MKKKDSSSQEEHNKHTQIKEGDQYDFEKKEWIPVYYKDKSEKKVKNEKA